MPSVTPEAVARELMATGIPVDRIIGAVEQGAHFHKLQGDWYAFVLDNDTDTWWCWNLMEAGSAVHSFSARFDERATHADSRCTCAAWSRDRGCKHVNAIRFGTHDD